MKGILKLRIQHINFILFYFFGLKRNLTKWEVADVGGRIGSLWHAKCQPQY